MKLIIRFKIRCRADRTANSYIYCRLTVNGTQAKSEMATHVLCRREDWDNKAQRIKGRSDLVYQQNALLEKMRSDLTEIFNGLNKNQNNPVTADFLKALYMGQVATLPTALLATVALMLEEYRTSMQKGTYKTYQTRGNNLRLYVETKLKRKDVELVEITPAWVRGLGTWQMGECGHSKNYFAKSVIFLKTILNRALQDGILNVNGLAGVKASKEKPKPIEFLEESEVQKLHDCPYFDERLQRVADAFLVQCYTGMAYNELRAFEAAQHLQTDPSGKQWIIMYRGKTSELCRIPLLSPAKVLLEKYAYKLPLITNQKMNEFLKEIGQVAQLGKPERLTTHVGRRTAGTFLLNRGVPIFTVSKILGHSSVAMTERHYAALLTSTIARDVAAAGLF